MDPVRRMASTSTGLKNITNVFLVKTKYQLNLYLRLFAFICGKTIVLLQCVVKRPLPVLGW